MFKLELPIIEKGNEVADRTSQEYFNKIQNLRDMQKNLLPLYLESQRVVKRHQKCLSTILEENEDAIPR